jgi:hypothetical protein
MALAKHFEEITERRAANKAAIIFEYQHPQANSKRGERLSREMVLALKVPNPPRLKLTVLSRVGFLTKRKAAETLGVPSFNLLNLDDVHGGMLVTADHLFISEAKVADGLTRYEPGIVVSRLIKERAQRPGWDPRLMSGVIAPRLWPLGS